jgi:hypothetical protein
MSVLSFPPSPDDAAGLAADRRLVLAGFIDRVLGEHANAATVSVEQFGEVLGISRGLAYQMCRENRVATVRVGKAIRVPTPALVALLLGCDPT